MRLTTTGRATIFCFALVLTTACSSAIAQRYSNTNAVKSDLNVNQSMREPAPPGSLAEKTNSQPIVSLEPAEVVSRGYTNAEVIRLRESPGKSAPVTAVLKLPGFEEVEILGAEGDYLHVRFSSANTPDDDKSREGPRQGWVAWGEVMPSASALVLDAETGRVVSRLPFNNIESGISLTFSPDNSKAVFYSENQIYEVDTKDYSLTRSLRARLDTAPSVMASFFYGSTDNILYAALGPASYSTPTSGAMLNIVRPVADSDAPLAPEISESSSGFVISPDGRTGFILHHVNAEAEELLVDVLDLQNMRVINTLTLRGERLPTSASEFVLSPTGSELYLNLFPSREIISVVETSTGYLVREIPVSSLKEEARSFSQHQLVGDQLLISVWGEDGEESHGEPSHSVWLDAGNMSKAEPGIDYAVEAKGIRLAVNSSGTQFFRLDADNKIREKHWISRPDLRMDEGYSESLGVYHLYASPDGKHLIIIVGPMHGC